MDLQKCFWITGLVLVFVTVTSAKTCSDCPAGSGVVKLCSGNETENSLPDEDTSCSPCETGVTFSDTASKHLPCRSCRTCPPNSHLKRECNVTHDAECECDKDHFQEFNEEHARHKHGHSGQLFTCKPCDVCQHGFGAARACSANHNTVCRKCPASTYSSVLSSSAGCLVCTVCREDQVTLHECTPIQDTVCADKDMGHPSRRVITKPLDQTLLHQQQQHQQAEEEYNNEGIISVYCAILGAIVLGLLIYVVMKQWRLRKAANKLAHFEPGRHLPGGCPASVPLNGSLSPGHVIKAAQAQFECEISPSGSRRLHQSDGSRGSDSELNAGLAAPGSEGNSRDLKPITQETRLREICTAKRREMESMLNSKRDHHDWKALARDLGYTSTRIASFEQRALEKQCGPTRHLFGDWAKREDSTVQNLISSLINIGRHDVTLVLLPLISQPQSRTTLPRTASAHRNHYKPISVV